MAPRARAGRVVLSADPVAEVTPETNVAAPHQGLESDALDTDIERVLDEIGESGGAVVLWREKDRQPGQYDYLVRYPAKGFTLEYVRENFGGGNYKIVPVDPIHGALNAQFFSIDSRWIGKAFQNDAPAVASVPRDDFRDRMLETMFAALIQQRAQQPSSSHDTIQLIAALAPLLRNENGADMMKTVLETATMLAQSMNPPEGMTGIVAGLIPAVERLASAHQLTVRQQAAHRVLAPVSPAPITAPVLVASSPSPAPVSSVPVIGPAWLAPVRAYVSRLVKLAEKDTDPTLYADLVIDTLLDDEHETELRAALESLEKGTLSTDAFSALPEMAETPTRQAWFERFVEALSNGLRDIVSTANETEPDAA